MFRSSIETSQVINAELCAITLSHWWNGRIITLWAHPKYPPHLLDVLYRGQRIFEYWITGVLSASAITVLYAIHGTIPVEERLTTICGRTKGGEGFWRMAVRMLSSRILLRQAKGHLVGLEARQGCMELLWKGDLMVTARGVQKILI
jgi:hypothetical protein